MNKLTRKRINDLTVPVQPIPVVTLSTESETSSNAASSLMSPVDKRKTFTPEEVPAKRLKLSSTSSEESRSDEVNDQCRLKMTVGKYIKNTSLFVQKLLGKGGFGMVYQIQRRETGNQYAVKQAEKGRKITLREIEVHNAMTKKEHLHLRNLLKCHRCIDYYTNTLFVMDLMDCDLIAFMSSRSYTPVEATIWLNMAKQIFNGLKQLNMLGYIHCDIKPENIMIAKSLQYPLHIKISDFGCCLTPAEAKNVIKIGTTNYRAPEMILGLPKDERLDTWSAGCTLWFLYTGRGIFTAKDASGIIDQIEDSFSLPIQLNKGIYAKTICRNYDEKLKEINISEYSKKLLAKVKNTQDKAKKLSYNFLSLGKSLLVDDKITNVLIRLIQPNASIRLTSQDTIDLIQQIYKMLPNC